MADNINLLPDQAAPVSREAKQNALVNKISAIVLAVTILAVVGIFITQLTLNQQVAGLDEQIAAEKANVASKNEVEGVYLSLASRVETAGTFLSSQNHYSRYLDKLSKSVPGGISLKEIAINTEKAVTVSGTASSYAELAAFQAKLLDMGDDDIENYFINPIVVSISRATQSDQIEFTASMAIAEALIIDQSE